MTTMCQKAHMLTTQYRSFRARPKGPCMGVGVGPEVKICMSIPAGVGKGAWWLPAGGIYLPLKALFLVISGLVVVIKQLFHGCLAE